MIFLIGLGAMIVGFALVWAIAVRIKNYGLLDVAWSYGILVLAPFYAAMGTGYAPRRWLFAGLGAAWSFRLGTHILIRVLRHHPQEDPRYEKLRSQWPGPGKFLLFFQLQALIIAALSLPFLLVAQNGTPEWSPIEITGLVLGVLSLLGETVADWQMERFKANPANKNQVCQNGLWYYSRHPNYFFESLIWWAFFLVALGSPYGWTTLFCPLLMLFFLLKITGITLTEEYSLKKRGEAYRAYQRSTSAFIPWFKKKA